MNSESMHKDRWKWTSQMASSLRFNFPGSELLTENKSQAWQDIFILSMLSGKLSGRYLEVGGHVPVENNNTWVLHKNYNWNGVTLELDPSHFPGWLKLRPQSAFVLADALKIDYQEAIRCWFGPGAQRVDYLQLDIDPSINTLQVLKRLPLDECRFSVITFETDAYTMDMRAREESRAILSAHGYEMVGRDVCVYFSPVSSGPIPFEDWWVDPEVVDREKINALKALGDGPMMPQDIIFFE